MAELGLALPNHVLPSAGWVWGNRDTPPQGCQQAVGQAKQSSAWIGHAPSMLASAGFIFGCKPLHSQGA